MWHSPRSAPAAWGLTYLATTEFLPPGRPLLAGAVRALPAGLLLAAIAPTATARVWWWLKAAVLGVLNIGAFFALLFVAAYRLPGGVAATLGAVQPIIAAGLAAMLLRERLPARVVVAAARRHARRRAARCSAPAPSSTPSASSPGIAGATSMATGVVLTKRWGRPVPLAAFTSWQLIAGGLMLTPLA